jgi:nucleotide-binding universal stress UspA family protein
MVAIDLVLAPTDCSDESAEAFEYAVAVADRYGAALHLLGVVDERVRRGMEAGDVTAADVAGEYQEFAADVEAQVDAASDVEGFTYSSAVGFSASSLRRTPGSVVLDTADQIDADFIVIPRETPSGQPGETLGKAALYVLEYASQPVLSI